MGLTISTLTGQLSLSKESKSFIKSLMGYYQIISQDVVRKKKKENVLKRIFIM